MELWMLWIDGLRGLMNLLSTNAGLGAGFGIAATTVLLRGVLLPIAWPNALNAAIRSKKLARMQGELQALKERFGSDPRAMAEHTMALYRRNGLSPFDGRGLLGGAIQIPVFLGVFQALRDGIRGGRFLWIEDLAKPDVWFALLAGATAMLMMAVNPDLPESMRTLMIVIPAVLAIATAVKFSSALAVYWTASNCFSALQTIVLKRVVASRIRSGAIRI